MIRRFLDRHAAKVHRVPVFVLPGPSQLRRIVRKTKAAPDLTLGHELVLGENEEQEVRRTKGEGRIGSSKSEVRRTNAADWRPEAGGWRRKGNQGETPRRHGNQSGRLTERRGFAIVVL